MVIFQRAYYKECPEGLCNMKKKTFTEKKVQEEVEKKKMKRKKKEKKKKRKKERKKKKKEKRGKKAGCRPRQTEPAVNPREQPCLPPKGFVGLSKTPLLSFHD